VDFIW